MPARCCIAPDIPTAIYNSGATIFPVWPTCNPEIHVIQAIQMQEHLKQLRILKQDGVVKRLLLH